MKPDIALTHTTLSYTALTYTALASARLAKITFLILMCCYSAISTADIHSLVILHSNDFHGHIQQEGNYAGAAKIAAFIKRMKNNRDDVLVVDAGDAVSGTPVSTLFRGTPVFEIMSEMNYDLGNLGNHEFDYGYRQIEAFKKEASFPILSANAFNPKGNMLADKASILLTVNKVNIGIIGVITESTPHITIPSGNQGVRFSSAINAIENEIQSIGKKADLIVVLSHLGIEEDIEVAKSIDGIALIIGGHSHTKLWPAMRVNNTWIVQADQYGSVLGKAELTVDSEKNTILSFHSTLIPASQLGAADKGVQKLVRLWEKRVEDRVDFEIAESSKIISGGDLRQLIEKIMTDTAMADFGYYNKGGIRDSIPQGKVTARHIWNLEPFGNTLSTMSLNGKQLKHLLLREEEDRPDFEVLDDKKIYLVATNNFVAAHALRSFGDDIEVTDNDLLIRDIIINHIRQNGF